MEKSATQGERALVAWAVLGDTVKKADLYEGLFGFVRPIAEGLAGRRFVPLELCEALRETYGLNMPVMVMESLSERLQKAGLLSIHSQTKDATAYIYAKGKEVRENTVPQVAVSSMLERFRLFIRSSSEEFSQEADARLDQAFFDRLMHIDSLALLSRRDSAETPKRTEKTLTLSKTIKVDLKITDNEQGQVRLDEHLDYLFATFLLQIRNGTPEVFELLCEIAGANLVAETLLTYRDPPKKGEALQGLSIYLDAPLCMDILGVNIGRDTYGVELSRALVSCGADLCVFLHSVIEVERVLEARKQSYLHASSSGPSIYSVEPPLVRDRVRAIAGHVEQALTDRLGCRVVDAAVTVPSAIRARVGAAEEAAIREHLAGWNSAEGREVDVSSVCDLIRLRGSSDVPTRLSNAGPTLATRNHVLKRAANAAWKDWLVQTQRASSERIKRLAPLAISDRHLAGLIWITQGGSIGQVSRELLVANCSAATALRRDVVVRVHNALIDTSPEDAKLFSAIILDHRAERALMDATYGDPLLVSDESVLDLLETVRSATAAEITAQKDAEIARIAAERSRAQSELVTKNAELEALRADVELSSQLAKAELERTRKSDQEKVRTCFAKACRGYKWSGVLVGLVLTALAVAAQLWVPELLKDAQPSTIAHWLATARWLPLLLFAGPTLLGLYEMPDIVFGSTRRMLADWLFKMLLLRHGLHHVVVNAVWDYRDKSIAFQPIASPTGKSIPTGNT